MYAIGQSTLRFADSIRKTAQIPALAYAVISADSIFEMQVLGVRKINTQLIAGINDRFRLGSNTKSVTGLLAALLVKEGKISWDTRLFDILPEMKTRSRNEYYNYTLLDLLTFRTKLIRYTYTDPQPVKDQFKGSEQQQRYQFLQWVLQQPPVQTNSEVSFSNPAYVAAGLMLEKVTGKDYKQLVTELGQELGIDFGFGQPNATDTNQPWGHNADLAPEAPFNNYKLNWLLPAGNINISLPNYIKFIQLQLQGLQGRSALLTQKQFQWLHHGIPSFAVGWFWNIQENERIVSYGVGNPGTFLAKTYVFDNNNRAFILLCNAQTNKADSGLDLLFTYLKNKYLP